MNEVSVRSPNVRSINNASVVLVTFAQSAGLKNDDGHVSIHAHVSMDSTARARESERARERESERENSDGAEHELITIKVTSSKPPPKKHQVDWLVQELSLAQRKKGRLVEAVTQELRLASPVPHRACGVCAPAQGR